MTPLAIISWWKASMSSTAKPRLQMPAGIEFCRELAGLESSARCRASVLPGVSNSVHSGSLESRWQAENVTVEGDGSGHFADEDDGVAEFDHGMLREEPHAGLEPGVGLLCEAWITSGYTASVRGGILPELPKITGIRRSSREPTVGNASASFLPQCHAQSMQLPH